MKYRQCPILMMYGKDFINFGSTLNVTKSRSTAPSFVHSIIICYHSLIKTHLPKELATVHYSNHYTFAFNRRLIVIALIKNIIE